MNYLELSKEVSYALRHYPSKYGLKLDNEGWTSVNDLLNALKKKDIWANLNKNDLIKMIKESKKQRHELLGDNIRALYGHSTPIKILKKAIEPPTILFHGTSNYSLNSIEINGLLSKDRQYVHLSSDLKTAFEVGKRHDNDPVILKIYSKIAWNDGIKFYLGNNNIWLADKIPPKYIRVIQ